MKKFLLLLAFIPTLAFADGGSVSALMGLGMPDQLAIKLGDIRALTMTAAGNSSQTNGTAMTNTVNEFTTVTTGSADSAVLPTASSVPRDEVVVFNAGAGILQVYPNSGGTIGTLGTNAAYAVAPSTGQWFKRVSALAWLPVSNVAGNAANGYFDSTGLELPIGKGITNPGFVPTMVATPVAGTNYFSPGLNVIPTAAANTASFLGSALTPIPGQQFHIVNESGAAVRIKASGAALMNGAGSAGGYVSIANLASDDCTTVSTVVQNCEQPVIPTPAGP